MRKVKYDSALEAIIKEQNQKWQAIARRLDSRKLRFFVHPDAFQKCWDSFKVEMLKDKYV